MDRRVIVHLASKSQREAMLTKSIEFYVYHRNKKNTMKDKEKKLTAIHIQTKWKNMTKNTGQEFLPNNQVENKD